MTTKETERDKPKCVKYWPDLNETDKFGPFSIKTISEEQFHGYVLREFVVSKGHQGQERKIYHFHFQVSCFFKTACSFIFKRKWDYNFTLFQ